MKDYTAIARDMTLTLTKVCICVTIYQRKQYKNLSVFYKLEVN